MAGIFRRETLTCKDVTQMSVACLADDFGARSIRVGNALDRTGNFLIKTRPAAAGMEFSRRGVEWCVAAATEVRPFDKKIIVLARTWTLGSFVDDNALFFRGERIEVHSMDTQGLSFSTTISCY